LTAVLPNHSTDHALSDSRISSIKAKPHINFADLIDGNAAVTGQAFTPPVTIKNRTHIFSPRNFYNAPDQLVPVDE